MFYSFIKSAIRYILRRKLQSVIQIASLTIGIAVMIQIWLYADHELSCEKFHEKIDRIYRLEYGENAALPSAIGHEIKEQFSEVENVVRITNNITRIKHISYPGKIQERETELKVKSIYCDSTIFDVFTLQFINGDPKTAFKDPFSVVLTESTAVALFGNQDPVGESVEIVQLEARTQKYIITGVIKDLAKSHLDLDILLSMVSLMELDHFNPLPSGEKRLNTYTHNLIIFTYLLLPYPHDKTRTEKNLNVFFADKLKDAGYYSEGSVMYLRPLRDIYFSNPLKSERGYFKHGNLDLLRILLVIAVFILFMATINFINLTTARSSLRVREVRVRKIVGSLKSRLIAQFLVESIIISLVSFLLAMTFVQVMLPVFNQLAMSDLSVESLLHPRIILVLLAGVLLLGSIAGLYPAISITRYPPVASSKGEKMTGDRSAIPRRILLIFQFTISVVLIICVFTILKQVNYMRTADLGFDEELVVNISGPGLNGGQTQVENRLEFKECLLEHPNIIKVAYGQVPGGARKEFTTLQHNGMEIKSNWMTVDPDYFNLMGMKILEGRNFSRDRESDYHKGQGLRRVVINETFMRQYQLESTVGVIIDNRLEIIGVIEDYHFVSLHHKIEPTHFTWAEYLTEVSIKILPHDIPGTLRFIKKEYKSIFPDFTFDYSFLDDRYDQQYARDEKLMVVISNFAFIAILIGCLGLFGLSFFMAARRTKEIGIRKVLGASSRTIFIFLSWEFIKLVALSIIIACPMAWIIMNRWLQSYAYRTNIGIWIFVLAALMAFAISFIAVAWHAWKTARTHPIKSLRYE
jgi:putative ABC transport system permease protein